MKPITQTNLYHDIHEQPAVLHRLLAEQQAAVAELAQTMAEQAITQVVIAARGTSDNAGRYAQYLFGAMNALPVILATPSLFTLYRRPPRFGRALVLGISQSGKSPDIIAVLEEARRQGALTAVITNHCTSELAAQGDVVIDLCAGREKAVAATKTYAAELTSVAMVSAALAGDDEMQAALASLPHAVARTLTINDAVAAAAPRYRYMQRCVVIGRGYNLATAYELALKLKELTYTIVEPYSSADFLHGPLAMLEPGFPVIVIAPSGVMDEEMAAFLDTAREQQAEIVVISDKPPLLERARIALELPVTVPEWLSPITAIVPGQLLAMHLAHTRDYDVDAPRTIRKVTETI
jgi:glucosamine--fructose-6-phosphate aminotransferase (isomerizing)